VDLMRRVVAKTPAHDDQDHIHLIVGKQPKIPSRIAHLIEGTGADPTPELIRIAVNLQRAGAHALAIPCNTAQCLCAFDSTCGQYPVARHDRPDRRAKSPVRRASRESAYWHPRPCFATELYSKAFSAHGIAVVQPKRQEEVMA